MVMIIMQMPQQTLHLQYLKHLNIMIITVSENVFVGENATIGVNLPKNTEGSVVIAIDNVNCSVNITDGVISVVLDNLTAGVHNITATYGGDDKYLVNNATGKIVISKVSG